MTDTKELVERVREALPMMMEGDLVSDEHAALSELEARLETAERELALEKSQAETEELHTANLRRRAEAAERERDEWKAAALAEDERRVEADRRVAELEEALREIAEEYGEIWMAGKIARAALDRAKL